MELWASRRARVRLLVPTFALVVGLAGCSSAGQERLIGTWENSGATWEVSEESIMGSFPSAGVEVESTYTATDTTLELTDRPGPDSCTSVGTYNWDITNEVLTLTLVSDTCDGRASALDGSSWNRSE